MKISIIPARGGSKRIPKKNIKNFFGKPMIAWSIESSLKSECFDKVIVSTDDQEIAEIAYKYGAEVPFIRPESLSDDKTTTVPVIAHAVEWCKDNGMNISDVCCVYATAPFVSSDDIRRGLDILNNNECSYVFSVTSYAFPIQRAIRIKKSGHVEMIDASYLNTRSQDLEECFHDAGQFYWGSATSWTEKKPLFSAEAYPLIIPRYRVQDIDTVEDWKMAEYLFKALTMDKF